MPKKPGRPKGVDLSGYFHWLRAWKPVCARSYARHTEFLEGLFSARADRSAPALTTVKGWHRRRVASSEVVAELLECVLPLPDSPEWKSLKEALRKALFPSQQPTESALTVAPGAKGNRGLAARFLGCSEEDLLAFGRRQMESYLRRQDEVFFAQTGATA